MFRMNGRNRKKASKEKNVESKPKYQEDFNEIILNDLVPEEKKEEFGLNSIEEAKSKKSGGIKLNFGLGGKKSSSKSKQSPSKSKDSNEKSTNQHKKTGKDDNSLEESSKGKKGTNKKKSSSPSKDNSGKSNNEKKNKNTPSKESNKKTSKGKTTKKTKSTNPSQSNIGDIQEITTPSIEENTNKKSIGPKKKRVKNPSKQIENENKRNLDEENEVNYEVKDNFDYVNFRTSEDIEDTSKIEEVEIVKEEVVEVKPRNRFENLVWSEDKFPKK